MKNGKKGLQKNAKKQKAVKDNKKSSNKAKKEKKIMSTVTKQELVDNPQRVLNLNRAKAYAFVELFLETIKVALENGRSSKFSALNFGDFNLQDKKATCPSHNPKINKKLIAARKMITFKAVI